MKRLLTFSLISLLVCSCRHRCKTYTRVGNHKEINDLFFFFEKGSYWVYKDSITGNYDTLEANQVLLSHGQEEGECLIYPYYTVNINNKQLVEDRFTMSKNRNDYVSVFGVKTAPPYNYSSIVINSIKYEDVLQLKNSDIEVYWAKGVGPIKIYDSKKQIFYTILSYKIQ